MKIFRHLGLMIAVFWCAAMVVAPMAAAAGAGQSTNQGIDQPPGFRDMNPGLVNAGNNQMQQGQGTGSENNQNIAGPGQGGRPQGMGRGNGTEFGNRTLFAPDNGNMTPPQGIPEWDPDNSTAINATAWHGHPPGNMSDVNTTGMPPQGDHDPANLTAANQSWHGHGDMNVTVPAQLPQQNGQDPAQQVNQNQQQGNNQKNSSDSLIAELIAWLKDHGIS